MRAEICFQSGGGSACDRDGGRMVVAIHLPRGWCEDDGRRIAQLCEVGIQGTRIGVEILMRRELGGVDEDADHHMLGMFFRLGHQRDMTGMKGAHGGHHAYTARS